MDSRVKQIVTPYYCRLALMLCQQARSMLLDEAAGSQASKVCGFVSTLCVENNCDDCIKESDLCSSVAAYCLDKSERDAAREACNAARRLCPKSYLIDGS